jgi:chromosome segregation ATPase
MADIRPKTGRPARTDEEIDELVWPVAGELLGNQKRPTNRVVAQAVRAQGNPISTVHVQSSLGRWSKRQPQQVTVPSEPIPAPLLQLLAGWLEQDRLAQRTELDARIAELVATNDDLGREALENEAEIAALQAHLAERVREHDTLAGHLAELTAGRDKLVEDLQRERETVEQLRTKLVTADLRVQEFEALRADHDKLRDNFQVERDARIQAERELAGERATREALGRQVTDLEAREKSAVSESRELRKQLSELTDHLQKVESQRAQAVGEASTAQGALKQLTTELEHQREDLLREKAEKIEAVRAAGAAQANLARAEREIHELNSALTSCRTEHERLVRENSTLLEQVRALSPPAPEGGATSTRQPSK